MARSCELCGKGTNVGNKRSHSNRATKRTFSANVQTKRVFDPISKTLIRVKVCTQCLRTIAKKTAQFM